MTKLCLRLIPRVFIAVVYLVVSSSFGLTATKQSKLTLVLQDVDIAEAMEMLSRRERVNILLAKDVKGDISVNLYDVSVDQAIRAIVGAAGYAVEYRDGSYFVLGREESGKYAQSDLTELRTFKVEYSDPSVVEGILKNYLSEYGEITKLPERKLLVIEDLPEFLTRIEGLLKELDRQPKQILIEAKILEITLQDTESFGLDWAKLFRSNGGDGAFGTRGLSDPTSPGLFFELINPDVRIFLDTLRTRGSLRTLSTPKLLALENQEAEAIIGDRIGFRVTTTINQVTTESVEFLESGVILRVVPSVDGQGRIMLAIHPEVSTATVSDDGIPSLTTTEVTTQMLVESGQSVFIGGLLKHSIDQSTEGVPLLGDLPLLGRLFSNESAKSVNTETVVVITPYIADDYKALWNAEQLDKTRTIEHDLKNKAQQINSKFSNPGDSNEADNPKTSAQQPVFDDDGSPNLYSEFEDNDW